MHPSGSAAIRCSVENAELLPIDPRESQSVCGPISRALAAAAQEAGVSPAALDVRVTARSSYRISAVVTLNGSALPDQHLASSDRALTAQSIDMLGRALAQQVIQHGGRPADKPEAAK